MLNVIELHSTFKFENAIRYHDIALAKKSDTL